METTITGMTLLARLHFLDDEVGAANAKRVLAKLSPEDQKILGGVLIPAGRYPLTLNGRLDGAIAELLDPKNPKRVFRLLGRKSAEQNFEQFHPGLAAPHDPHVIMSRIGAMRRLYYGDGQFSSERTSATSVRITVRGMATVTTPDCESTAGFYEVAIGRSGGRDVDVRHRCRLDGEDDCQFECSWRAAV